MASGKLFDQWLKSVDAPVRQGTEIDPAAPGLDSRIQGLEVRMGMVKDPVSAEIEKALEAVNGKDI